MKLNNMEWETLLIPATLSAEELKLHVAAIDNYIQSIYTDDSIDLSSLERVTEVPITEELLASEELKIDKISNDELFDYLKEENVTIDLNLRFPKIKRINHLFWFLHNLTAHDISSSKLIFLNTDDLSVEFYRILESAMFFDYLQAVRQENVLYFIPTQYYESFMSEPIDKQYALFLASLGRNETVSEALKIQLNDPIYDNISRQMVFNLLVKDLNIQQEQLAKEEINQILNNFRYWYLNIKQIILDN